MKTTRSSWLILAACLVLLATGLTPSSHAQERAMGVVRELGPRMGDPEQPGNTIEDFAISPSEDVERSQITQEIVSPQSYRFAIFRLFGIDRLAHLMPWRRGR